MKTWNFHSEVCFELNSEIRFYLTMTSVNMSNLNTVWSCGGSLEIVVSVKSSVIVSVEFDTFTQSFSNLSRQL